MPTLHHRLVEALGRSTTIPREPFRAWPRRWSFRQLPGVLAMTEARQRTAGDLMITGNRVEWFTSTCIAHRWSEPQDPERWPTYDASGDATLRIRLYTCSGEWARQHPERDDIEQVGPDLFYVTAPLAEAIAWYRRAALFR